MSKVNHRPHNHRSLPKGATPLEQQLANAQGEVIANLRTLLDDPNLSDEDREVYEADLYHTAEQLRDLRQSIYDRITE